MAGLVNVWRELRHPKCGELEHQVDSSACRSILLWKGCGQLKHVEVRDIWTQRFVKEKGVRVVKVSRADNAADALASPCSPQDLERHMARLGMRFE